MHASGTAGGLQEQQGRSPPILAVRTPYSVVRMRSSYSFTESTHMSSPSHARRTPAQGATRKPDTRRRSLTPEVISAHAQIGTAAILRQSLFTQVLEHEGSRLMQTDSVFAIAEQYGVSRCDVTLFEGKGESAAGTKERPEWEQLLDLIRANRLGLVIFTDHHRLARNTTDTDTLIRMCRKHGVLICVGKQCFNPANYQDRGYLRLLSAAMSVISEGQVEWFEDSKYALARRLGLRIKLPTGLVWVDPDDLNYRTRMERAGLTRWLDDIKSRHREVSTLEGKRFYILPYPDADVVRACELRMQWLLETQSLSEVYRRIRTAHAPWPRKGLVPNGSLIRWTPQHRMTWKPLERRNMADWYRNPLLYGIYATYRLHFASSGRLDGRKHKGVHYTRAGQRLLPPLPSATELLLAAAPLPLTAPSYPSNPTSPAYSRIHDAEL